MHAKNNVLIIEKEITDSFDYANQLACQIGSSIIEENAINDYSKISKILKSQLVNNSTARDLFSFTIFDWSNASKKIIISGPYGILDTPKDVSFRNYAKQADKKPWKIHFDYPDFGLISGHYVLPAGMGVVDHKDKFVGIVSMGFNLSNFLKVIDQNIKDKDVKYYIFFNDSHLLLHSSNIRKSDVYIPPSLLESAIKNQKSENIIKYDGVDFIFNTKVKDYPFTILLGYDHDIILNRLYSVLIPRAIELLSLAATCIVVLVIMRRKILSPIFEISAISREISQGNLDVIIPKYKLFELSILANQMSKVIFYAKQLATLNKSLELKISERTAELTKALSAKTEFLNNMSHEIRTPIQGFTAISEGLSNHWGELSDKQKEKLAQQISQNAKRLSSLVGSLLDLSRFNDGKMLFSFKKINLNRLINNMIDECKTLYLNNKNLSLEFEPFDKIYIYADEERINQVFRNVLTNAIKFTRDGGNILIQIMKSEIINNAGKSIEVVDIKISDNGIGVPESELKQIFLPLVQSSKTKTKAGGTGLGLAISNEIVNAHHGKIWAENNSLGGATINIILPLTQSKTISKEKKNKDSSKRENYITILMIDDEESCLISMELILKSSGYNLIKASGGHEALEILTKHNDIDLILLDLMMPDMYGLNVLEKIKEHPKLSTIPIILQSGTSDIAEIEKAYKLGIVSHIHKPYNRQFVIDEISRIFEGD